MKREQRLVDLKIEQFGKPTSEKMTSHGSVSDLQADIVSVDRVLIRLIIIHIENIWSLVKGIKSTCILSFFFLLLGNWIALFFHNLNSNRLIYSGVLQGAQFCLI